jgi:UDP-2-acetamido-3-amino-2,3-dideoxy-glucuronate N-acetyltransferase
MHIALIGAGYWGKNLLRNFYELGVLTCVCDKNPAVIEERKAQYPGLLYVLDLQEVLVDKTIDAVVIATPAITHFDIIKKSLLAGKHVYVEKPMCMNDKQSKEIRKMVNKSGLVFMVGHLFQYHPAFLKAREIVDSGVLGKIRYIYSNRISLGKIRSEENVLWSLAPHDFSIILALMKRPPIKMRTDKRRILGRKIYDSCHIDMEFSDGVKGHIFVSWMNPFKEQRFVVIGDQKSLFFDELSVNKLSLVDTLPEMKEGLPVAPKLVQVPIETRSAEPLKEECLHFIECLKKGTKPWTDVLEGSEVVRMLNWAERSGK